MSKISHSAVANWGTGQSTNTNSSSGYQRLTSQEAFHVSLVNNAGTTIAVRKAGSSNSPILIPANFGWSFTVAANADEIEWRRADENATSVSISYYWGV